MIDLILLEQLIAFNDFGTLSKAAEQLNISQPALTRSMQRLEDELGIQLFIRTKNRMTLTDTGYYTVSQARQLLRHTDDFIKNPSICVTTSGLICGGLRARSFI